jgi:hypothetical protein
MNAGPTAQHGPEVPTDDEEQMRRTAFALEIEMRAQHKSQRKHLFGWVIGLVVFVSIASVALVGSDMVIYLKLGRPVGPGIIESFLHCVAVEIIAVLATVTAGRFPKRRP